MIESCFVTQCRTHLFFAEVVIFFYGVPALPLQKSKFSCNMCIYVYIHLF